MILGGGGSASSLFHLILYRFSPLWKGLFANLRLPSIPSSWNHFHLMQLSTVNAHVLTSLLLHHCWFLRRMFAGSFDPSELMKLLYLNLRSSLRCSSYPPECEVIANLFPWSFLVLHLWTRVGISSRDSRWPPQLMNFVSDGGGEDDDRGSDNEDPLILPLYWSQAIDTSVLTRVSLATLLSNKDSVSFLHRSRNS